MPEAIVTLGREHPGERGDVGGRVAFLPHRDRCFHPAFEGNALHLDLLVLRGWSRISSSSMDESAHAHLAGEPLLLSNDGLLSDHRYGFAGMAWPVSHRFSLMSIVRA
jgi:hypothetical protein